MLIQHHIKYKEIHGVDEIVLMTVSDHRKLHHRLRKEGKCNIPPKQLEKISHAARRRSPKGQETQHNYFNNPATKKQSRNYHIKYIQIIQFQDLIAKNVMLYEKLFYNINTGAVYYSSGFQDQAKNKQTLKYINEKRAVIYE